MRSLLLFLAASLPLFASTVTCTGSDASAIQTSLNAGGTTTLVGSCNIGGTTLGTAADNTTLTTTTGASLTYSGGGYALNINNNNVTVSNLTINGGGIFTTQNSIFTPQSGITITGNTIQNITANGPNNNAILANGYWSHVTITHNIIRNITSVPLSQITTSTNVENCSAPAGCTSDQYPCSWAGGTNNCYGGGIGSLNGNDNVIIEHNTFDTILGNAISPKFDWTIGSTPGMFTQAANNSFSYNTATHIHRMLIESGGGGNSCPGGCSYGNYSNITNWKVAGNFFSAIAPYGNSYGLSIPVDALAPNIINNTMDIVSPGNPGFGYEEGNKNELFQGNVSGMNAGLTQWGTPNVSAIQAPGYTIFQQNNIFYGPPGTLNGQYYDVEGFNYGGTRTNRFNINGGNCPISSNCSASTLATAFITSGSPSTGCTANAASFPSGGNGTWCFYATNQVSVVNVQFFIDGSSTPTVTQEIQDLSSTFTSDARWQYHATINTSGLSGGSHTIMATATDVTGATSSKSQTFTTGSGPGASFSPTSLNFGSITLGSSSSPQATTLTNTGTTTLTITGGATITGANAGDFSKTTTCTASLAAAATCTVTVTFTPTALGSRIAFVTITDNAAGSPHQVQLTGGASLCQSGNLVSNCDFNTAALTPWSFAGGSSATIAVDNTGPGGTFAAHITATASVPPGNNTELFQDGLTFPANGTMMQVTFSCMASRSQAVNVLGILSVSPFTSYGLAWQPIFPTSYQTCVSPFFKVINSPAAGTGRLTGQADNSTTGDQIFITNVNLVPAGSVPASQLSATSAVFGTQNVGTTQTGTPITITNGGVANLVISGIAYSGGNASDFGQTNTCGTVTPGSTCTITPTFTPSNPAARVSSLVITSNDSSVSPQSIPVSGIGVGVGQLVINSVGYVDHSTAQLIVTSATALSGNTGAVARLRAAIAPGTCAPGTGGLLQPMEIGPTYDVESAPGFTLNMDIAGLTPNSVYNVCPEMSYDGGSTWTTGVSIGITTLPLPAVHPALPIPPATFDPSYPNTSTGFDTYNVLSDCSNLGTVYTTAVGLQATRGAVILIPAGTVCGAAGNLNFSIKPVDVQGWVPANVNTGASTIALGGTPTLTVGQGIRFGRGFKADDTYPASTSCEFGQGLQTGMVYYVASVSAGNVVTLLCNDGVTPMVFTSQGAADSLGFYWVPANRTLQPIIVRSATPDSQLPPAGTAITPAWLSKMAIFQSALTNLNVVGPAGALITMGGPDGNSELMTSNIRIGPGIEITVADSPEAHTSSDPLPFVTLIQTYPFDDHIIFDRDYIHLLGAPNRDNGGGIFWDGYYNAIINSYFDNLTYFHSEYSGVTLAKTSNTTFTVAAGIVNEGQGNVTVPAHTVTVAGTGSGEILVGLNMASSNAFTVWTPAGESATCSPACANATVPNATNGSCNFSDGWPKNTAADHGAGTLGNPTVGQIGCIPVTSGTLGSVIHCADGNGTTDSACPWVSAHYTEGAAWMIGGIGPGPYVFQGNFSSGAGLLWHHDDSGVVSHIRGDYTYFRNYFQSPFKYMYNPANLSANPASDGLGYYVRQPIEWKGGRRVRFNGNICDGNWVEVEASAGCVLFTAVNGMGITDVDITNNSFLHQPGVVSLAFVTAGSNFAMPPPVLRYRLRNNFAWDIGNPLFFAGRQSLPPPGWIGEGPNATQDIRFENNTIAGNIGTNPAVMWPFDTNAEGVSVTNNILYINSTNQGLKQDGSEPNFGGCPLLTGKALADCKFTPSYVWQNNLMVPNGQTVANVQAAWPTLPNYFGSSTLSSVGWAGYQAPPTTPANGIPSFLNLALNPASLWKAGSTSVNSHDADVGADLNALAVAQGSVTLYGVPANTISTTGASISYLAPDSGVCSIDLSSTDPNVITSFTRVADSGGARARSTAISGLTTKTHFNYRLECSGNAVMSQRTGDFWTK